MWHEIGHGARPVDPRSRQMSDEARFRSEYRPSHTSSEPNRRLHSQYLTTLEENRHRFEQNIQQLKLRHRQRTEQLSGACHRLLRDVRDQYNKAAADAECAYTDGQRELAEQTEEGRRRHSERIKALDRARSEIQTFLRRRRFRDDLNSARPGIHDNWLDSPVQRLQDAVKCVERLTAELQANSATRLLDDGWPILIFIASALATVFPAARLMGWRSADWVILALVAASTSTALISYVASVLGRAHTRRLTPSILEALADADHFARRAEKFTQDENRIDREELDGQLAKIQLLAQQRLNQATQAIHCKYRRIQSQAHDRYVRQRVALRQQWENEVKSVELRYQSCTDT